MDPVGGFHEDRGLNEAGLSRKKAKGWDLKYISNVWFEKEWWGKYGGIFICGAPG